MLLLGTVAGCSKSSVGNGDEDWTMNFVCSSLDSRAAENTSVEDLTTNGINLVGYASSQSDIYVVESPLINTSGSVWEIDASTSNATSEWPASGTVDFFAYSPSSYTISSSAETPLSMSHAVSSTIADQVDLMIASAVECSSSGGAVALEFNHALSCISFAVYNTSSESSVEVSKIEVTVAKNSGTLSVGRDGEVSWGDLAGSSTTYDVGVSTEAISSDGLTVVNAETDYLKLIPQTLSLGDKISMSLTVNGVESTLSLDLDGVVWSVGEKYTYTVSVSDKEITFGDVVVSDWTDQEEANISESDGIVNLNIYNTADLLESIVTDFTLFNIKNVSVIGESFDGEGAIAFMSDSDYMTTYMSGNSMSCPSNSPYISILSNIGRLDLSSVTGLSDYTVPMLAFSPGLKFSSSDIVAYSTSSLHTVLLPEGVTGVGQMCFAMSALEEAYYDNLTSLGDYGAFYGCASLRTVSLAKVTKIPSDAFCGCTSLSRLLIPSVTAVESGAFQGCTSLTEFIISYDSSRGEVSIDSAAFSDSGITYLELLADLGTNFSLEANTNCDLFVIKEYSSSLNYSDFKSLSAVDIGTGVVTTTYNDGSTTTDAYEYDSATGTVKAKQ